LHIQRYGIVYIMYREVQKVDIIYRETQEVCNINREVQQICIMNREEVNGLQSAREAKSSNT
jgi:hypothetical protein